LSALKIEEAEVLSWWNSNKKNTLIWSGLQEGIFRHHHLLFIMKGYFQKLVTCTNKSEFDSSKNRRKTFISSPQLEKTLISTFVD